MSFIEYHDPDGIYPLISQHLQNHLPLRNLHWSSPGRPVRSIPALFIDLVSDNKGAHSSFTLDLSNAGSNASAPSRRHQLPGLRSTPYLKLFILRCDDKDSYKNLKKESIKSWINDLAPSSSSSKGTNKQENHDAFEWLILHVVLPNTQASTEPRWTRNSDSDLEPPKEKDSGGARWPGKRPRSILERLRRDFNASGKSAPDRIAQIRLKKDEVPLDIGPELPAPTTSSYAESPRDRENAWSDLMTKLKTFILRSFNLRVTQYEEDIHEKELQRTLPGWNFCTFFVLKEGLARVFESIGLIEDALRGYEELSAGLDSILDQRSTNGESTPSTAFQAYTQEFADILSQIRNRTTGAGSEDKTANAALQSPFDSGRRNYRELIVANQVSVFDFRCYIYSRKISLMIRKAKQSPTSENTRQSSSEKSSLATNGALEDFEDTVTLANICQISTESIPYLTRLLRHDLMQSELSLDRQESPAAIDILVASWTYAAAQQIFNLTRSKHFPESRLTAEFGRKASPSHTEKRAERRSQSSTSGASLNNPPGRIAQSLDDELLQRISKAPGILKAAAHRADLCMTQRRILEKVLKWRDWRLKKDTILEEEAEDSEEAQPEPASSSPEASGHGSEDFLISNLPPSSLHDASFSVEKLKAEYEALSDSAAWLFSLGGRERSSEQLIADLAVLKFNHHDYSATTSLLGPLVASFNSRRWNSLEAAMLRMHAVSLRRLNRKDDHIRTALSLLAKYSESIQGVCKFTQSDGSRTAHICSPWFDDSSVNIDGMLDGMVQISKQLPYELQASLTSYFDIVSIDRNVEVMEDQDGFTLGIILRPLLATRVTGAAVKVYLIGEEDNEGFEVWLETSGDCILERPQTHVKLHSHVSTFGTFSLNKVTVQIGRVVFLHEALERPKAPSPLGLLTNDSTDLPEPTKRHSILCYSRVKSFGAGMRATNVIHMGKPRALELELSPGDNSVQNAQVSLKSGTAGLRIYAAKARDIDAVKSKAAASVGVLDVAELAPQTKGIIVIPYEVERDFSVLRIRLEVSYSTDKGSFTFISLAKVDVNLALDVNVQDIFSETALFSKFFLASASLNPVHVLKAKLDGNDRFQVTGGWNESDDILVLPSEPSCISYSIAEVSGFEATDASKLRVLPFVITYQPLLALLLHRTFCSFRDSVRDSNLRQFSNLILPVFKQNLETYISSDVLGAAALVNTFAIPSYEELGWALVFDALPPDSINEVERFLRGWHESNPSIDLTPSLDDSTLRRLHIDFGVPAVDFLHTASLNIRDTDNLKTLASGEPLVTTGAALPCNLTFRFTTRWASQPPSSTAISESFVCELTADPSQWLISGPMRFTFTSKPEQVTSINITLIPLQAGYAPLPSIEISPLATPAVAKINDASSPGAGPGADAAIFSPLSFPVRDESGVRLSPGARNEQGPLVTCETDCTTGGQGVWAVEGLEKVVLGVGREGDAGAQGVVDVLGTKTWEVDE